MFAKEVIEELKFIKRKLFKKTGKIAEWTDQIINEILKSQKFHFGDGMELYNFFYKDKKNGEKLYEPFTDPNISDLRLPYPTCWFDYSNKIDEEQKRILDTIEPSPSGTTVRPAFAKAYLLEEITHNIFSCISFAKYNDLTIANRNKKFWDMTHVRYFIKMGGALNNEDLKNLSMVLNPKFIPFLSGFVNNYDKSIIPLPFDLNTESFKKLVNGDRLIADMYSMLLLEMSLSLLNCKNIITEKVDTLKVRIGKKKKLQKIGSVFEYHVLNVVLPYKKELYPKTTTVVGGHRTMRAHMVRGHYKRYTEEKPLFGKYTGRYFWPSHISGIDNFLKKDYIITTNKSLK